MALAVAARAGVYRQTHRGGVWFILEAFRASRRGVVTSLGLVVFSKKEDRAERTEGAETGQIVVEGA